MRINPNKPKPLTINGVLVIGYMNAAKLLDVPVTNIGMAIKNGHRVRGFEIQPVQQAWMDV